MMVVKSPSVALGEGDLKNLILDVAHRANVQLKANDLRIRWVL
jgi:hypothetical protein